MSSYLLSKRQASVFRPDQPPQPAALRSGLWTQVSLSRRDVESKYISNVNPVVLRGLLPYLSVVLLLLIALISVFTGCGWLGLNFPSSYLRVNENLAAAVSQNTPGADSTNKLSKIAGRLCGRGWLSL